MGYVGYLPGAQFNEFGSGPEFVHWVPLEPVDAVTGLAVVLTRFATQMIAGPGAGIVNEMAQHFGVNSPEEVVKPLVELCSDALRNAGWGGQQTVIKARMRVRIAQNCQQYDEIEVSETTLEAPAQTVHVGVDDLLGLEATFSVRHLDGNFIEGEQHCSDTAEHAVWHAEFVKWMERMDDYEQRMSEWREKLKLYLDTDGETEFPFAPTELPPPWADELQPPPAPPMGYRRSRRFHVIWSVALNGSVLTAGVSMPPVDFQESDTVITGPCCIR